MAISLKYVSVIFLYMTAICAANAESQQATPSAAAASAGENKERTLRAAEEILDATSNANSSKTELERALAELKSASEAARRDAQAAAAAAAAADAATKTQAEAFAKQAADDAQQAEALAKATKAAASVAQPQGPDNDRDNYLGDKVTFRHDFYAMRVDTTANPNHVEDVCVRAQTELRGIGTYKKGADTHAAFMVVKDAPEKSLGAARCAEEKAARKSDVILVPQATLLGTPPARIGLTYGTLLVPYKYHIGGSKTFTGAATVGGYLGYRQDNTLLGLELQYVVFLGAAPVAITRVEADGTITERNEFGASFGIGVLGTVKGGFHMGAVIGADRVNDGSDYEDNGKAWIALELGYSFSN